MDSTGRALEGKVFVNATTTGGPEAAYQVGGRNRFTMRQLLAPFDQTAVLCRMAYLAPFVVHGTHTLDADTGCCARAAAVPDPARAACATARSTSHAPPPWTA